MVRIIILIVRFVRFVTPWVVKGALAMAKLVGTAIASLWAGVPSAVRRIANHWLQEAIDAGFPTQYAPHLYYILCVVAFLEILAGWIISAYITVGIVNWIWWRLP